ncbi:MAG: hypothetical protein IJO59_00275, partial [Clostridia bacterium]|nr:hypothetical protein [Clostridia bacterium]
NRYDLFFEELNVYQMREPVYFTAYKDGVAVSKELKYSVQTYAGKNADVTAKNLGDLVVAMMKYGDSTYAYVN